MLSILPMGPVLGNQDVTPSTHQVSERRVVARGRGVGSVSITYEYTASQAMSHDTPAMTAAI
jgi:hypothetical protein